MATFSALYTFDMSVLANYQALMGDIFDQIVAMGWVQTADAGQTDPGSVVALPAQNVYSSFAIFKPGDALTPFYFKVAFGRSTGNWPQLQVSIGSATDGAGTLTGNVTSTTILGPATVGAGLPFYISGDAGWIGICGNPAAGDPNQTSVIIVERTKDGTGADADGFATLWVAGYNGSAVGLQHTIMFSGTNGVQQLNWRAANPRPAAGGTLWTTDTHIGVSFCVPMPIPFGANPSLAVGQWGNSLTAGSTTIVNHYGDSHTYLAGSRTVDDASFGKYLMRFE